eukprot:3594555-Rhodomonas_salina.1
MNDSRHAYIQHCLQRPSSTATSRSRSEAIPDTHITRVTRANISDSRHASEGFPTRIHERFLTSDKSYMSDSEAQTSDSRHANERFPRCI